MNAFNTVAKFLGWGKDEGSESGRWRGWFTNSKQLTPVGSVTLTPDLEEGRAPPGPARPRHTPAPCQTRFASVSRSGCIR